jgi:MFS family permease
MPEAAGESRTQSSLSLLGDPRVLTTIGIALVGTFASNIASPVLPAIADTFAVSDARVGLVMTAFTVPTIVFVPITGVLADTYGRRPIVLPSLVLFGAAGVAIGQAPSFEAVLALRAIQGSAFAGVMPLTVTILGDLYAGAAGSTAQGLRVSLNGVSSMATPAITGFLVAIAWSHPFALYALAVPAALVAYVVLPETGTVDGGGDEGTGALATLREYVRAIWTETDDAESRTLLCGGFARDFLRLTVMTFVPLFAVASLGATPLQAGIAVSMRGVPRVVVSPLAGSVVGRFSQKTALVGAFGLAAVAALAIAFSPSVHVLWGLVALYGAGDSLLAPVLKNAVADLTTDEYRAGVINGLQVLKSAAQSIAPALFGLVLAVAGFEAVFLSVGAVGLGYVGAVALLVR